MTPFEAKEKFLEIARNNNGKVSFYGYMYGRKIVGNDTILDMQVYIKDLSCVGESFNYVWGWPGPDYNTYRFADYGETWAFSMEDFV